jgi:hypothetical protein
MSDLKLCMKSYLKTTRAGPNLYPSYSGVQDCAACAVVEIIFSVKPSLNATPWWWWNRL